MNYTPLDLKKFEVKKSDQLDNILLSIAIFTIIIIVVLLFVLIQKKYKTNNSSLENGSTPTPTYGIIDTPTPIGNVDNNNYPPTLSISPTAEASPSETVISPIIASQSSTITPSIVTPSVSANP